MKRALLVVALLSLAAIAAAVAAPAASPHLALRAVAQPVPAPPGDPAPANPCASFCAIVHCVEGTTCGQDPATGKCGCLPDKGSTGTETVATLPDFLRPQAIPNCSIPCKGVHCAGFGRCGYNPDTGGCGCIYP